MADASTATATAPPAATVNASPATTAATSRSAAESTSTTTSNGIGTPATTGRGGPQWTVIPPSRTRTTATPDGGSVPTTSRTARSQSPVAP